MPVDKSIMDALNEERGVAASSGRNYRQLKLERNQEALTRFLPAQLGPRKTWYARIGRHWVNKRPIICVRHTSPDFGGDPNAPCILCDLEQKYLQSRNKMESEEARKMGAFPKWLCYLFCWEIINERGHRLPTSAEEMYLPTEYWLGRDGFSEVSGMWQRSVEKISDYGFLDPELGYDITVKRDTRGGYRHQREDPAPVMKGKTFDEMMAMIDKALSRVVIPDTNPPSADDLEAAYEKAEDLILGRRVSSRTASGVDQDDSDDRHAAPRNRRDDRESSAPSRRGERSSTEEAPARESRREAPPSRTAEQAEPRAAAASREAPPRTRREEPPTKTAPESEAPPARRAAAPPPARRDPPVRREPPPAGIDEGELDAQPGPEGSSPEGEVDDPPPVRSSGGAASPSRRAPAPPARAAASTGKIDDDPEVLPPERRDAAPPEPAAGTAPRREAPAQRALTDNMRSRVSRIGNAQL